MKTSLTYRFYVALKNLGLDKRAEDNSAVAQMQQEIASLSEGGINFSISTHEDGSWSAKSINVDSILTGGLNQHQREINATIKDAILTYYGISPSVAHDVHLRNLEEPVTVERSVHVTA
jgi:hypothetical protein